MKFAGMLALFAAAMWAQPASMEGTVVNGATGAPMAGVHVRVVTRENPVAYGAISDRAGRFSIASIQAGEYLVLVEHTGFLEVRKRGESPLAMIVLKAGQRLAGYKIELTPRALISGRVVDEFGDPVENVTVKASDLPSAEPLLLVRGNNQSLTDDRGEFRLVLPPGKYYLKASSEPNLHMNQREVRADGSPAVGYGITWYPNVAVADRAAQIDARAGRDLAGIEIRLGAQRILNLEGFVTGPEGPAQAQVELDTVEGQRTRRFTKISTTSAGRFMFTGLPPGVYRISATSPENTLQSQVADIRLETADEKNVQLTLVPGGEISGTLDVSDAPAARRTVQLENADEGAPNRRGIAGEADANGAFRIAGIPPGRYRVRIDLLPDDAYVKTVQVDGVAASQNIVDFSRGAHGSKLKIAIGRHGAHVSGSLVDKDGSPVATLLSMVVLLSDSGEQTISRETEGGKYSFKGVAPGKYRLFAVDGLRYMGRNGMEIPNSVGAHAEEIELREGDRITKDVKLEVPDAGAKQ